MFKINHLHLVKELLRNAGKQYISIATIKTTVTARVAKAGEVLEETRLSELTSNAGQKKITPQVDLSAYTTEQQQKILQIINEESLQELLNYDITKARATKLSTWKARNGPLKSLEDILMVEGFGMKMVEKFYRSLLEEPGVRASKKPARARIAPFITPSLDIEQQHAIRSCVSVRIGVSSVTWARLEVPPETEHSPCLLTHWQHHEIVQKKLHLNDLVQRCLYVDHLIPAADCYLFENPQMAQISNNPGSAEQQNINIQKAQVTAMLSFALSARNRCDRVAQEDTDEQQSAQEKVTRPHVFYLRRFLTARLFNQLVGTERVSSEETVMNLMRTYYNVAQLSDDLFDENVERDAKEQVCGERLCFRGNVQFPEELRKMFARAERYHREFLGQSLLLNLAFVRLVLLQDMESIAAVTKGSNKNNMTT